MAAAKTVFDDTEFLDHVVGLLTRDAKALHTLAPLLEVEDFKPLKGVQWGSERWVVADRALSHYQRFHQPLGKLLRADILDYANGLQLNERQVDLLEAYVARIRKIELVGAESVVEKVKKFKLERFKAATIQDLIELQASGQLTNEKWMELTYKATGAQLNGKNNGPINYFDGLQERINQRSLKKRLDNNPMLLIEPLDQILYPGLGPKQLGLILAPTNRGKSLFLIWIAMVTVLQRCNVLFITLEDSAADIESRLDAAITGIPFNQLESKPTTLRNRFESFRRLVSHHLHIVDGTDEKYTVPMVEKLIQEQRNQGFPPDVVIVDYDDYLTASQATKNGNRLEIMDVVYRDLKLLGAKYNLAIWTAAQTQRNTSGLKVLTGDKVADDIGKIRKSTIVISLGQGELGEDSLYLWVAKNKMGKSRVGCHIIPDLERTLIYDHEATRKALMQVKAKQEESEEYPSE